MIAVSILTDIVNPHVFLLLYLAYCKFIENLVLSHWQGIIKSAFFKADVCHVNGALSPANDGMLYLGRHTPLSCLLLPSPGIYVSPNYSTSCTSTKIGCAVCLLLIGRPQLA